MSLPLTILGGYLGAGKTTLVNRLLRTSGRRLAVLVNEFGALPIDADLIEAEGDDLIALAGGCVCCAYGDDLMEALVRLTRLDPAPDHIVLESSGVAMPGAIGSAVGLIEGIALAGIVVLADAGRIGALLSDDYLGDTVARQVRAADLIVLTHMDLAEPDAAEAALARHAPGIPVARNVPEADVLLAAGRGARPVPERHGAAHRTRLIAVEGEVDVEAMVRDLSADTSVVRAKGHARTADGRMVTLQLVAGRAEIAPAPPGAVPGIVVISTP